MLKILTFDVGETTGYCLLGVGKKNNHTVLKHGTFTAVSAVSTCLPLFKERADLTVVERTAVGEFGDRLHQSNQMYLFILSLVPEARVIRPVDWKSGPWKNVSTHDYFPESTKLSKHEKDAFRIAIYAMEKMRK
jgi:hypothetical protein